MGSSRDLARTFAMGFNKRLARIGMLGFKLISARTFTMGFNLRLARMLLVVS
jgi:hypothetical protein